MTNTSVGTEYGGTARAIAPSSLTSPPPTQPRLQQIRAMANTANAATRPLTRLPSMKRATTPSAARMSGIAFGTVRATTSCSAAQTAATTQAATSQGNTTDDQAW